MTEVIEQIGIKEKEIEHGKERKRNVPQLRFKEFEDEWEEKKLNNFLKESRIVGSNGDKAKKLTVKLWAKGVVAKKEIYEGSNNTQYYIRKKGQLIYGKLDFLNCAFGIIPDELDGYESTIDSPAFDINNIVPYFLYNKIIQKNFYKKNGDIADGSRKAKRIHQDTFLNMSINVPSLQEQKKIADFLSLVDRKIEKQSEKVEALKTYKKGMIQKIFSQEIRFKDDNGEEYPEWEENKIKQIFNITRGEVIAKASISNKKTEIFKYPVYSSQTTNKGILGYDNKFDFNGEYLTWTTDGANAGKVFKRKDKFRCTNVCGLLVEKVETKGFANNCIKEILDKVTPRHVSYVGNPKLMNNVMSNISINIPCLEEQIKISNFLNTIDKKIEKEEEKLEELKTWKKGLLQKMFV